ncbi:hypothetical protein MCOR16_000705 [Pyricularia oryzae]|nr:hypothetical protein MCOR15_007574 [Pyricularia oryzae]KAI6541158.1 hypothetical protein MCOR16_000705 [Pyricularia oryzae]
MELPDFVWTWGPLLATFGILLAWNAVSLRRSFQTTSNYPIINYQKRSWTYAAARRQFVHNARQLLVEGSQKFSGPFKVITLSKPLIILPPEYIDAINAERKLSFLEYVREEFLSDFDTFRTCRPMPPGMFSKAIQNGINRRLPKFTQGMSSELSACLDKSLGYQQGWHEVNFINEARGWVAHMTTLVFLGESFAHNQQWIDVTTSFVENMFMAMAITRSFHPLLRPLVDRFSPLNRKVRKYQEVIASILGPVIQERHMQIKVAEMKGQKPDLPDDSIEWFRQAADGFNYPEIWIQMGLNQVSMQTTSNQLCQSILYLCANRQYFEPLRQEAIEVLQRDGLEKAVTNMHSLTFMDSFLKEAQRLKPEGLASMHRRAMEDVQLGPDVTIRKGEHLAISAHQMWQESNYPNPEHFDPYRFIERRKNPKYANRWAFVSTSPDHMGFSHGKLACPGRFLASSVLKIAMLHLILKYDLRIADPKEATPWFHGTYAMVNTNARIWVRSRKSEVDLESLARQIQHE